MNFAGYLIFPRPCQDFFYIQDIFGIIFGQSIARVEKTLKMSRMSKKFSAKLLGKLYAW